MKENFLEFALQNPDATQADAAAALGVTKQRISQLCKSEGVQMRRPPGRIKPFDDASAVTLLGRRRTRFVGNQDNSTIGALAEIIVCADLLDRGLHVFRAVAPNSPFDLVVQARGELLRVEVKTSRRGRGGEIVKPLRVPERFDILACVLPGPEVHYFSGDDPWDIP